MRVSLPFVFVFAALLPFAQGDNPFWDSWGHLSYLDEKRQTKSVLGFRFLNGGPGHMGVIRDFKEVTPEFNLRGYMIKVDRGIYTELVHRDVPYESKLKSVIEGDEAREYLVGFYKKMAEKNPSSHTFADFEAVQRLMTPKILVPSIIEQVQQPEKYKDFNATSDIDTPKNNPPMFVKIRSYAFNVSNDNAKQYTEKKLNKLFTRWQAVLDAPAREKILQTHTPLLQFDTVIKSATAQVTNYQQVKHNEDEPNELIDGAEQLRTLRMYSSKKPATESLVIEFIAHAFEGPNGF